MKPGHCILALDLGTSSFKCAPVNESEILAEPIELQYDVSYHDGHVQVDEPEELIELAFDALVLAYKRSKELRLTVHAIGICSQAQSFTAIDHLGGSILPVILWSDHRAILEAEELGALLPEYEATSGFAKPSPQQFLPKVPNIVRDRESLRTCLKFVLLNEFVISRLTGGVYGDSTLQGMGGFFDIRRRRWNGRAFRMAGIKKCLLAVPFSAASFARPVLDCAAEMDGIPIVPVYSCSNDQCCSAIGAGLEGPGDVVCTFGTAMVAYTICESQPTELAGNQIAGIDPLTDGWFLLAYESHCGDLLDWAHRTFYADVEFETMLEQALDCRETDLPEVRWSDISQVTVENLSIGHRKEHIVRVLLIELADRFERLLEGVRTVNGRLIVTGGLSRSNAWLRFLESRHNCKYERAPHEHSSLICIARVIGRKAKWNTDSNT